MKTLAEAGLSHDPMDMPTSKSIRRLVRARREYAEKLADKFLSGPACILLQDQDAVGIERMEWRLVNELDAALQLSAQVWAFQTSPLAIRGIEEFGAQCFGSTRTVAQLCQAQQMEMSIKEVGKHDVIAVLRPEIMALGGDGVDDGLDGGIWTHAQVFVSPRSVVAAEKAERRAWSRPASREE